VAWLCAYYKPAGKAVRDFLPCVGYAQALEAPVDVWHNIVLFSASGFAEITAT
jgi:hypothetical protein